MGFGYDPAPVRTYKAGGAIPAYHIVQFGAADDTVVVETSATGDMIGVIGRDAAASGERVDVVRSGFAPVKLAGVAVRGNRLTADVDGRAKNAGAGQRFIGIAEQSGDANDVIEIFVCPGGDV